MSTCKIKLVEGFVNEDQSLDDLSLELFAAVGDIAGAIIFKDDISHKIGCAFAIAISIHKIRLCEFSMDSRVARITRVEDQFHKERSEAEVLVVLFREVGMWVEGGFYVFGGRLDRLDEIIYALMYLANCNNHKLLDCLGDYLKFSAELAGKPTKLADDVQLKH